MFVLAPKTGGSAYRKAAEIFADLYARVTGVTLAVKTEPSDTEDMVIIGLDGVQPYAFGRLEGGFPVRLDTDEYCIISKTEGERTLLFLGGGRGRSTLYAVYDFFERQAGCHYFWDGDVIPLRDSIDISGLNVVEKPRFTYRAIRYFAHRGLNRFQAEHWDFDQWKQEIDWAVKSRLNTVMLRIGMDDVFQKAFPDIVSYPPENEKLPGTGTGYNNRTFAWSLQYRGELRKKVLDYVFENDLMHPEDFGTMTHWYSRTPVDFLEKVKPSLMEQSCNMYADQTGQVWDIFDDENVDNYLKLTDTHIQEYGKAEIFHTIGLAERMYFEDREKNLELKKFAYKRFISRISEKYPNAKIMIATWDFFFRLKPGEAADIIKMFDPDKTLVLDYTVDLKMEGNDFENWDIMGKMPYIFGLFHGYQPQNYIHGDYDFIGRRLQKAAADEYCKGMDFWPELSHSDTLMLTYFTQNAWNPDGREISEIARELCDNRYGESADAMWNVWQAFLPVLKLPTGPRMEDHLRSFYLILNKGIDLTNITNMDNPDREKAISNAVAAIEQETPFEENMAALLRAVLALPAEVLASEFVLRDCVDLVRTVTQIKLNFDYRRAALLFADWQADKVSGEKMLSAWERCEVLADLFAEILNVNDDYSMHRTLERMGENRPVNPYFEEALKDNVINNYCRSATFEAVRFVYCKEARVYGQWIEDCVQNGKKEATPTDEFEKASKEIIEQFKAMPLSAMQTEERSDLRQVTSRLLTMF